MQEALEVISEAQPCRDLLHRALNSPSFSSQPPSEEKINGILLGYRIRYRELLYDRLRSYSVHTISSVSTWAELTGEGQIFVFDQRHSWFLTTTFSFQTTGQKSACQNEFVSDVLKRKSFSIFTQYVTVSRWIMFHVSPALFPSEGNAHRPLLFHRSPRWSRHFTANHFIL